MMARIGLFLALWAPDAGADAGAAAPPGAAGGAAPPPMTDDARMKSRYGG